MTKSKNTKQIQSSKRLIISFFSSKITFFAVTTVFILGLNLTPLIVDVRHAPEGRNFPLIHNNVQDYFFYQSLMNEGSQGKWLTSDPFTSEPHQPSIIFSYFVWLGKLSKLLGVSNALTYHLSRFIFGFLLLFAAYFLIYFLKIPYPRLTYLFFLFAAPFMHTINDYGRLVPVPYMNWWNGIDPIRRAAFLPHHMLGGFLLIASFVFLIKYFNGIHRSLHWALLIIPILAFIHPPSLLIILIILPAAFITYYIISKQKINRGICIGLLVYWVIGLLLLFLMVILTNNSEIWSNPYNWEKTQQLPLDKELIGALGILFPLSIVGIIKSFLSKRFDYILLTCWFAVPLLLIPFAPKLGIANVRLIQGVPYLPMAILAVLGIDLFAQQYEIFAGRIRNLAPRLQIIESLKIKVNNLWSMLFRNSGTLRTRKFHMRAKTAWLLILIIFLIYTIPTLSWSLKDQIREYWPIFGNVYLDNRLSSAFKFINNNYGPKTITLSTFYSGNYLPAYTNTTSFIGHFGYTFNEKEKEEKVDAFFKNKMTDEEAKQFLVSNKITLVFQGPEEKPLYTKYLYPTLLKPVYDKEEATIYKTNY